VLAVSTCSKAMRRELAEKLLGREISNSINTFIYVY
jgi:hypothetical protein